MCFWTFSFRVLVLECLFLCRSLFLCISFSEDPVWFDHPFSFLFFSFYILSLLTRMLNGDFQSESIACVVDTSHSARQGDMDDMVMKRSAANKRDKTSKAKQRWILNYILLSLHFKPQKKFSQKAFIFCFCWVPFLFHLVPFNIFFQHFFLCSLFPSSFGSSLLLFSPFSSLSFLHSFFFSPSLSVFLFLFMTEDKTRHQEKWVKAVVRMVTNVWKGGLLLACFWAWLKVSVDGPESTKESALADDFWLGLTAIVCFLWLSDLCVTQTARGTPASECLSSSPSVFSLSTFTLLMFTLLPQHVAKSYWKDWATWGGEAEPRRFDGLCRRSKEEDRARKTKSCGKTTQWHGRRNKQTGR